MKALRALSLRQKLLALAFPILVFGVVFLPAQSVSAVNPFTEPQQIGAGMVACNPGANASNFFGLPPWYKYLTRGETNPAAGAGAGCRPLLNGANDVWLIVAAIFEIILRISGIAAVAFVLWGGIQYTMSQGAPDRINNAKNVLTNALVGLVIVILSSRLVAFGATRFNGGQNADFLLPTVEAGNGALGIVINLAFQAAAILAIIFVIIGGITLTRSNGDSGAVQRGRQMIIFALVGMTITLFARVIVQFIMDRV